MSSIPAPASRSRYSRSLPALPVATTSLARGALKSERGERALLGDDQFLDALGREREHRVELGARVRCALGRRLQFDETPILGHHAVEIGRGVEVLRVVEVEHG